jgi:probable H4MPT-linked C1 transfer pathway protein
MLTLGWDLGGAHVKCVVVNEHRQIEHVVLEACPLWRGIEALETLLAAIVSRYPEALHGVTMSGEMVDLFNDRAHGVSRILDCVTRSIDDRRVQVFTDNASLVSVGEARRHPERVASANWLAPATWLGRFLDEALFFDVGSTTTDILRIKAGRPAPRALGDHQRLISKELIYTGVVRTPLMALGQDILMGAHRVGLMAEFFATSADLYRILGTLPENADHHATADGGPKTRDASIIRLARMVGADAAIADTRTWIQLAQAFSERQQDLIEEGIRCQPDAYALPWITSGVGGFLIDEIARKGQRTTQCLARFFEAKTPELQSAAAQCAPAAAVALIRACAEPNPAERG